jgi:hypothetical protein
MEMSSALTAGRARRLSDIAEDKRPIGTHMPALSEHNSLMNGLYDGEFVGFRIASSGELDTALSEAMVAVDANVLLDVYRFRPQASQDLIKTLKSVGDRLVVPHQALREFWRRRQRSQNSPRGATKALPMRWPSRTGPYAMP